VRDQEKVEHPRTVVNRLDTAEAGLENHEKRVKLLEEWLDLLYRRVGIPYPGNEPTEITGSSPVYTAGVRLGVE
jgi:hypothetical protein